MIGTLSRVRVASVLVAMGVTIAAAGCGSGSSGGEGPGSTPTPSATSTGSALVLSDTGVGELKLGVSLAKARALGMVGKILSSGGDDDVCAMYQGKQGVRFLYFTHDQLVIIATGPKIRLDTGPGVGSTFQDLHDAYGERLGDSSEGLQRIYISAPGAPFEADYRIGLSTPDAFPDTKVTDIALQSVEYGCYE